LLSAESAGSSVSTSARDTPPEALPSSTRSEDAKSGALPIAVDEPAYISLEGRPPDIALAAESAPPSDKSEPLRIECSVLGNAWVLCQKPDGSRRVQEALDEAPPERREAVLREFHGRAVKGMRDPHANHVLQKLIALMAPGSLQFMVDELLEREGLATAVARHRYGGRIVQQLLKKCSASQVSGLAEALLQEAVTLSIHNFGHFSMQHLLHMGTEEQRHRLVQTILDNPETICKSKSGDGVVASAMEHGTSEQKLLISRAVLLQPGLMVELAQGRHGHSAVLKMLQVLEGQESLQAHMGLAMDIAALRAARYGRVVAKYLEEKTSSSASPQTSGQPGGNGGEAEEEEEEDGAAAEAAEEEEAEQEEEVAQERPPCVLEL